MFTLTVKATRKLDRQLRAAGLSRNKTVMAVGVVKNWLRSTTVAANEDQVGGKHYYSDYQHWDWIINCGMGYLEAAITKYVYRWRTKNGVEDLRKSGHYCDKLIEVAPIVMRDKSRQILPQYIAMETARFLNVNKIANSLEGAVCRVLSDWRSPAELVAVRADIATLVEEYHNDESLVSVATAITRPANPVMPGSGFHDAAK